MAYGLAIAVSYLIGSIPTAFVLMRVFKRIDIRTVGSGNVGATNAMRAGGVWMGLAVLVADVLKGMISATAVASWLLPSHEPVWRLACGLAAVVGHAFPVFLKFRGGKGVATTIGALLATMPSVTAIGLGVWVALLLVWRVVSVSSLAFAVSVPLLQAATGQGIAEVVLGAGLAALIVGRHRSNIARLLQGQEPRASFHH